MDIGGWTTIEITCYWKSEAQTLIGRLLVGNVLSCGLAVSDAGATTASISNGHTT